MGNHSIAANIIRLTRMGDCRTPGRQGNGAITFVRVIVALHRQESDAIGLNSEASTETMIPMFQHAMVPWDDNVVVSLCKLSRDVRKKI